MPPRHAYHFQKLRVDLDKLSSQAIPLAPELLRETIGGCGLGVRLLLETESPELDPFDRRGSLLFVFSPLVGSPLTTSAKFAVVSKSPLTGRINDSLAGSGFALAGKKTGFDAIELTGRARRPIVVVIDGEQVTFEPAEELWGCGIYETEQRLRAAYGSAYRLACIGPAGENRVLFATISHDGRHAGRGGSGAVMGDKNVKAILVRGNRSVDWADPPRLHAAAKQLSRQSFGPATAKYRELGTAANLLVFNRLQCLPTRNFADNQFELAEQLAPESLAEERQKVRSSCAACTIGCEHIYSLRKTSKSSDDFQSSAGSAQVRLEYESLFALGPMCGMSDADTILEAARLCDDLGLDTVSTGGTLAFAMECHQRRWWPTPLRFGDGPAMLAAIEATARRVGPGDSLANGSRILAAEIGHDSLDFAPQIKGLEIPGYDPRKLATMALGFAVGARGADHNKSSAYEIDFAGQQPASEASLFSEPRIREAIELEDKAAVMDSLILCKFLRNVFADFFSETAELLHLATGWKYSAEQLRQIGAAIIQDKKRFNVRAGWTPDEDRLPEMIFDRSRESGQANYSRDTFQSAIENYNRLRGWTPEGFPVKR